MHADIDLKDVAEGIEEIERLLKTRIPDFPPSVLVRSGNGVHAYWLFREAIKGERERVEAALRQLADLIGGDTQVCEIARLMRLPGSHNSKRGAWTPVTVSHQSDRRYELSELEEMLSEQSPIILRKGRVVGKTVGEAVEGEDGLEEYAREGFKAPIDVKAKLDAMMYAGNEDASIHKTQLSVSAAMLNKGHDIDKVVTVLLAATKVAAGDYGRNWNWAREERSIRKMCETWLNKRALEGKTVPTTRADAIIGEAQAIDRGTITQDGVAQVFARRYKGRLRYCHDAGAWYEWTGTHWQRDTKALAFQFVRELGREFTEAPATAKPDMKEVRRVTFAGGVEKFAKGDPVFAVDTADWDQDLYLLGTPAGTVDLRTGKLRGSDPADGITKVTSVAPAEKADCPLWLKFLNETFGGDQEMIRFAQQWSGYCLTGDTREQALFFGTGDGGNGKGVWLHTVSNIMNDYHVAATMQTFTASTHERHSTELGDAARGANGDGIGDREGSTLGGGADQAANRRRPDHLSIHAAGRLHLLPAVQTEHHRQPQAAAPERRCRRAASVQHHPLRQQAGGGRSGAGVQAHGRGTGDPALADRRVPGLAAQRSGAAAARGRGDRELLRRPGQLLALAR